MPVRSQLAYLVVYRVAILAGRQRQVLANDAFAACVSNRPDSSTSTPDAQTASDCATYCVEQEEGFKYAYWSKLNRTPVDSQSTPTGPTTTSYSCYCSTSWAGDAAIVSGNVDACPATGPPGSYYGTQYEAFYIEARALDAGTYPQPQCYAASPSLTTEAEGETEAYLGTDYSTSSDGPDACLIRCAGLETPDTVYYSDGTTGYCRCGTVDGASDLTTCGVDTYNIYGPIAEAADPNPSLARKRQLRERLATYRQRTVAHCPRGLTACRVGEVDSLGFECIDTRS